MEKGPVKLRRERNSLFNQRHGVQKLIERDLGSFSRHVSRRGLLKIQRTDAV
jgi:hypothetical protein